MIGLHRFCSVLLVAPASSPELRLILTVALFFLATALFLFLFIIISRIMDGIRFRRRSAVDKISQRFITSFIFEEEELNEARLEKFRNKFMNSDFNRQIFLQHLIILRKNIIGELSDKLQDLYRRLGLYSFSKQKLYVSSWDVIAKGIGELAEMGMRQDSELIRSFINHPNTILRSEAQIAFLKLQNNAPFSFLDDLEEPLLDWPQMQLGRAAQKTQLRNLPQFERWLNKKEPSIVIFCIRMISLYSQHTAAPRLIALLEHPVESVRLEAIAALCHLEVYEATDKMTEIFEGETMAVKLVILKTLPVIGGDEQLSFYESLLFKGEDKGIQLAASKAIVKSGRLGEAFMAAIQDDLQHALQPIAAFALDKRL